MLSLDRISRKSDASSASRTHAHAFVRLVRSFDLANHLRASYPCQTTPRPASCLYSLYSL